ncbi:MAG: hypothetical protein FJY85_23405 [Deltaproteobacteria bacterium]|nr:hypothetical protein [Deltaproteobacteria bacterium]
MKKSSSSGYMKRSCCVNGSCVKFKSPLEVADCYKKGGRVVKDCSSCK